MKSGRKPSAVAGGYGMNPAGTHKLNRKQRFSRFIYNKEDHSILSRKCGNWGQFVFFFIIHLLIVVGIYFTMFFTITRTMDKYDDRAYIKKTFEGDAPVLSIQPNEVNKLAKEQVMWYTRYGDDADNNRRINPYISATTKFLKKMHNKCLSMGMENCTYKNEEFGPCSKEPYGYNIDRPCLYVKLNVRPLWEPMTYEKVPDNLPDALKELIELHATGAWINCEGADNYHKRLLGKIKYFPSRQFHNAYFPYKEGINLSPVIAIQLRSVRIGYVIKIQCKLYTANASPDKGFAFTWIYLDIK